MDVNDSAAARGFRSENDLKEIKVKLPIRQHIKLHSLKLLKRESISDTVLRALTEYFDRMESAYGDSPSAGAAAAALEEATVALDVDADALEGSTDEGSDGFDASGAPDGSA